MTMNRRTFVIQSALGTAALASAGAHAADAPVKLAEADAQATAMGYKLDASKVDKAKWPKYASGQLCSNCQLYQSKSSQDAFGGCPIFGSKQVAAKGWCNAYVKKA